MQEQDTANKVINRLAEKIGVLIRENTILHVMMEEQSDEIKRLLDKEKDKASDEKVFSLCYTFDKGD